MSQGKKKKTWLKIVLAILIILVLAVILSLVFIDSILKGGIQTIGSTVTQCQVTVDNVNLSFRKGELLIEDFVIGNPDGYKTDHAISFDKIFVSLVPSSLFGDTISITKIEILAPELVCEVGLLNSNLGTILDNINQMFPPKDDKDKEEPKPKDDKPGKKVEIDLVEVRDGKISLSAKLMGGKALPIPLPSVSIKDIGKKEQDKVSTVEAAAVVLREMLIAAVKSVGGAGTALTDSVKDAGAAVTEGVKDAGTAVTEGVKDAGTAVTEGVKDAGTAVTDSIKDAGTAVTEGVKGIGKGLKGILSGGEKE